MVCNYQRKSNRQSLSFDSMEKVIYVIINDKKSNMATTQNGVPHSTKPSVFPNPQAQASHYRNELKTSADSKNQQWKRRRQENNYLKIKQTIIMQEKNLNRRQ